MRTQILATLLAAAIPLAALAQGAPPQGAPQGQKPGTAAKAGPGRGGRGDPERMEKRMRLARTLGLAEALDLDAPAALKLGEIIGKFDERRLAAHKQMHEARQVLRRAAQGETVPAAEVDQAVQRSLEARAQLAAIDKETVAAVTQGLTPEKKARAVLFLARVQQRFGPGMGPGMGGPGTRGGRGGPGMGPGMRGGRGPGGFGAGACECDGTGPGPRGPMMGMAMPPPPGDDFDDEPED